MNTKNKSDVKVCFISPKAYPLFNPSVKKTFGGAEVDFYLLTTTALARAKQFSWEVVTQKYLDCYKKVISIK
jgi:hypothetical protein